MDIVGAGENVETGPPPSVQPPDRPIVGYWADDPGAWGRTFEGQKAVARQGGKDVVFLGDSITQAWDPEVWRREWEPLRAVNFGIGGDKTCQLLYRLDHGLYDGLDPKLTVLKIGVNNLWDGRFSAEEVAGGIGAVVARLRALRPGMKVLLLGVLPTQESPENGLRAKVRDVNAALKNLDDGEAVRFRDLGATFLEPDGRISPEVMPDFCHLSREGYERFARVLAPSVRDLLK